MLSPTKCHDIDPLSSRHEDSLLPRGPQPRLSNPAPMGNPRLDSWHLAARQGKLSPAFFSQFQVLLGMP